MSRRYFRAWYGTGSATHVIAAHSLDDLRTKIAAAERPSPQPGWTSDRTPPPRT